MGNNAKRKGFEDLAAHGVAHDLFGRLQHGDKLAFVSRFPVDKHIQALRDRGLQVRLINQTGVQDFCFLLQAQKELVGTELSTCAIWAAFLNQYRPPTLLYIADSPGNRRRYGMLRRWVRQKLARVLLE